MGNCASTRLDSTTRLFDVLNVDARLFQHSKGQLQITSTELVLHQQNGGDSEQTIRWPLNGVRRYGYYRDIFLFESGRKCATGQGLFAFKCVKSKRLNDTLHKIIVENASTLVPLQVNSNLAQPENNHRSSLSDNHAQATLHAEQAQQQFPVPLSPPTENTPAASQYSALHQQSSEPSPYYVNDFKTLVRLPSLALSCSTNVSEYINADQIDPTLLRAQMRMSRTGSRSSKIERLLTSTYLNPSSSLSSSPSGGHITSSGQMTTSSASASATRNDSHKRAAEKSKVSSILTRGGSIDSCPSDLNYVDPVRLNLCVVGGEVGNEKATAKTPSFQPKIGVDSKKTTTTNGENAAAGLAATATRNSEYYSVIDSKKTTAITSSMHKNKQRHIEYAQRLSY